MLKGDGDTYIYIIDKNYKILYCNDNALQKFPCVKVGELCYHAVREMCIRDSHNTDNVYRQDMDKLIAIKSVPLLLLYH